VWCVLGQKKKKIWQNKIWQNKIGQNAQNFARFFSKKFATDYLVLILPNFL
jgi:hypothetical protein